MSRSGGRARQTITYVLPQLPKALYAAAVTHGRQKPQRPVHKGLMSDELLSHMRWEREVKGSPVKLLAAKYGIPVKSAERLLGYFTRIHVQPAPPPGCDPQPDDAPTFSSAREAMDARNRAICAACNGRNYARLAREYSLSEGRVRGIVSAARRVIRQGGAA